MVIFLTVLFLMLIVLTIVVGSAIFAPYLMYLEILNTRFDSELFPLIAQERVRKIAVGKKDYLADEQLLAKKITVEGTWQRFSFGVFEFAIPIAHPLYRFIPDINVSPRDGIFSRSFSDRVSAGMRFITNSDQVALVEIMPRQDRFFSIYLEKAKFLNYPLVKELAFSKMTHDKLWEEIFTADLTLQSFFPNYSDLARKFLLLNLRNNFFLDKVASFAYIESRQIGIVRYPDIIMNSERYLQEEVFFFLDKTHQVFSFDLTTKKDDVMAGYLRMKIIREVKLVFEEDGISDTLFKKFQKLPYQDKIDEIGLIYLYSAWSHITENKQFMREMIRYLERKENGLMALRPLYEFSLTHYGVDYSAKGGSEGASLEEKILREREDQMRKDELEFGQSMEMEEFNPGTRSEDILKFNLNKVKTDPDAKRHHEFGEPTIIKVQ